MTLFYTGSPAFCSVLRGSRQSTRALTLQQLQSHCRRVSSASKHAPIIQAHNGEAKRRKSIHRLFLAGVNPFLPSHLQSSISPVFTEVPLDEWISSISGRNAGISIRTPRGGDGGMRKEDIEVTHLASGLGHAMIAYRDRRTDEEKIFAIGRNESGQLGLGYNSQVRPRSFTDTTSTRLTHLDDYPAGTHQRFGRRLSRRPCRGHQMRNNFDICASPPRGWVTFVLTICNAVLIRSRPLDQSVLYVAGNQHRGRHALDLPERPSNAIVPRSAWYTRS